MTSSQFGLIFSLAFMVALTGAMSPGPLFTYTIMKSIKTPRRGFLMGLWIVIGHAILEFALICILLLGFAALLQQSIILKIIGVLGCGLLLYFGISIILDVKNNKISTEFLTKESEISTKPPSKGLENPIIGGVIVSMSNPYWWLWWAAIGFAFMLKYNITFTNIPGLVAFFLGHEMGDLVWYFFVSVLVSLGKRAINKKIYYAILILCGLFMIGFGLYLGISPFIPELIV
jgi:threonine/homoserine/homoserine lactone efflux protein